MDYQQNAEQHVQCTAPAILVPRNPLTRKQFGHLQAGQAHNPHRRNQTRTGAHHSVPGTQASQFRLPRAFPTSMRIATPTHNTLTLLPWLDSSMEQAIRHPEHR